MDTFFRRHFKRKEAVLQDTPARRQRRPSVAVPTSKARRRSSAGLPSGALTQQRRSSIQLQQGPTGMGGARLATTPQSSRTRHTRRRSSTTTPSLNPRFAVRRRKAGKLRTIDAHLLGPSVLLASLIQMAEEEEGGLGVGLSAEEQQVEVRGGANNENTFSCSSSFQSDGGDDSSGYSDSSQSESSQPSEVEQLPEEEEEDEASRPTASQTSTPSSISSMQVQQRPLEVLPPSRPLIRAPRCLRRNSSCCRASSQRKRRRISTASKAGSPWPGRGRKSSMYYLHHPAFYRGPGALSPLGAHSYESSLTAFLLYVVQLQSTGQNQWF